MPKYIDYPNREEWLKGRVNSLGASEVASVLWQGFQNAVDIWKEKTGLTPHIEKDKDERVDYGFKAEGYLRSLFALKFGSVYNVEYFPYRVYSHDEYPFLTATLDGELTRAADNKKGVWECKTVLIMSKKDLEQWDGVLPNKYYIQVLEQLCVMNYDFAVLTAELRFPDGNCEIRNYTIERDDQVERDIQYVESEAVKFWTKYVIPKKKPPIQITL